MKLMVSGVAICAGMTRSPSFSRSSSSTRMNMRPLRASSMISSIGEMTSMKLMARSSCGGEVLAEGAGDVAREEVDLEIDPVARAKRAEAGRLPRMGYHIGPEARTPRGAVRDLVHGERDAVERDRALGRHRAPERARHLEEE